MFTLKDQVDWSYIVGFRMEDGEHGVFKSTEKAQQAILKQTPTHGATWIYWKEKALTCRI